MERLVTRLKLNLRSRPKNRESLLRHLSTAFGNKLSVLEQEAVLDDLTNRGVLKIDGFDKVNYAP